MLLNLGWPEQTHTQYTHEITTVDSGNSKRLNSKPSLNSKRIFLVTPIVL